MLRKILLPIIFAVLAYGFWLSPDFKEIAAGVAIFLFGMLSLEEGFRAFTGGILERFLKRSTASLWKSLNFGIISTTLMQSSSLVSVITISFLSAGLITLAAGIGIIFGANIGTTTGAWLVAGLGLKVKISAYAMPMLVFGVILLFQKSNTLKGIGYILAGLGFLFLGIHHMKVGFESFKDTIDLTQFAMTGYAGLFVFVGIGTFATVVMQSSHATLVLIITALAAGQITYENGLALAIGANIGTTITAILGALSANEQGKRLAAAHLIFNVITGLIAIGFIHQMTWAVDNISEIAGIAQDDYTLKLAVFHTIFNVVGVVVMVPFIGRLVTFLESFIKAKPGNISQPRYLNDAALEFPDTALRAIVQETHHLFQNAFEIIAHGINMHRHDILSDKNLMEVVDASRSDMKIDIRDLYQRKIKIIYSAIIDYTTRAQTRMDPEQVGMLYQIKLANRDMVEAIKDIQDLQVNTTRFMLSDNPHIRHEYNVIRAQIGEILRAMHRLEEHPEELVLEMDRFLVKIEQQDILANGTLDRLIREGLISNEMATSLMNDSAFAYEISRKLISVARFAVQDISDTERSVQSELALDEEDVENLMKAKK
jgi:phosphate:Na+ symporter